MKKKLVSFVCAVMAALCLVVSVPVQAYAAPEDEIAPQYIGISELSEDLGTDSDTRPYYAWGVLQHHSRSCVPGSGHGLCV